MSELRTSGERIKYLRLIKKITQVDLGRTIGVSRSMICEWEKNVKRPNADMAIKLAEALNSNSMYILCEYEHPEPFIKLDIDGTHIIASSNLDESKIKKIMFLLANEPDKIDEKIKKLLSE